MANDSVYEKLKKVRKADSISMLDAERLSDDLELRHYQKQMVYHLLWMQRFVVGDDTGLGKTIEVLATFAYLWKKQPQLVPYVVTKTSALFQWGHEIDTFMEGVDWRVTEGGPDERKATYHDFFNDWDPEQPEILITNYPRMRIDSEIVLPYTQEHDLILVGDECTAFKNPDSKTHNAFKRLACQAKRCYGLTATIIKNNLMEGYGIYKAIRPRLFPSERAFRRRYCNYYKKRIPGGRKVPIITGHDPEHIKKFRSRIDPYFYGRAKQDVADELPTLSVKKVHVPLNRKQWDYYMQALRNEVLSVNEDVKDAEQEDREMTKLTKLIYTQEIVDSPYLIGNEHGSEKTDYLLDLLKDELSNEKVIVFTRFKDMVDRIESLLIHRGWDQAIRQDASGSWEAKPDDAIDQRGFARITGDESDAAREAGKRAFQDHDNTELIFLTKAGLDAINLQQARVIVFFDLPWSAGDYLQLLGRAIRIGSPHESVYAIHLLGQGPDGTKTIDHHVQDTLDDKMDVIEGVIGSRVDTDGDDQFAAHESMTESIFQDLQQSARELETSSTDPSRHE